MSRRDQRSMWSGLAPAVDAHIDYWARANRAVPLAFTLTTDTGPDRMAVQLVRQAMRDPHLYRWIVFGSSYGIPDADGIPQIVIRDIADDDSIVELPILEATTIAANQHETHHAPAVVRAIEGTTIVGREQFSGEGAAIFQGLSLAKREHSMLGQATSHYVSAEVMNEVSTAAALASNEPLHETDVFCPAGFAVFEEPLLVPDLDPDTGVPSTDLWVHVRAMGWQVHDGIANVSSGTIGKGVSIFFYTTREDYEEGYYTDLVATGRKAPYEAAEVEDGFLPIEVLPWTFGVSWDSRQTVGYIPGTVPTSVAFQRRWFFAFMRLMWQQIIVQRRDDRTTRQQRRQLERLAERKPLLDYTILRLRRVVDPNYRPANPGTGTVLDHRVLARGYWMHAWLHNGPARDAAGNMIPETHRLVWVEPAWRGPEDGPIGAMEHATVVVR